MSDDRTGSLDDAWAGERVQRWLRQSEALDAQMAPITEALFAAAALRPGERVLDVGCGTGPTTRHAAGLVGGGGHVTGLDLSADMLAAARSVPTAGGAAPITWLEADVVDWIPALPPVDAVISRFGVMFFDDPRVAFGHLADAAAPGGRLCAVTWAHRDRSEIFEVPYEAVRAGLAAAGCPADDLPVDQGAFSLGDEAAVRAALDGTGWEDVACTPTDVRLRLGGGAPPEDAARASLDLGPSRVLTSDLDDPELRDRLVAAVADAYRSRVGADGAVELGGRINLVTATRPGP